MMTVHKLSAGDGYQYYTSEVASADVLRDKNRELGDYYTVEGMPPGQWIGQGATKLELSGTVNEAQMSALYSGQQLPYTTAELTQLLAQKPDLSEKVFAESFESASVAAAHEAWELHLRIKQGYNQTEIVRAIPGDLTQQRLSQKIAAYRLAGNDFTKGKETRYNDPALMNDLKAQFVANYTMTKAETERATSRAEAAAAAERGVLAGKNAETPHTYNEAKTPYMRRYAEELARFNRLKQREPDKEERREISNRVGGELFRAEHKREPRTNEEFARWVASQRKPQQQSVAGYDLVFTPTKSVSIAWGLGDDSLRKGIESAHEKAIRDVIDYLENNAVYTRRGAGGIVQESVKSGLIATKFRHYDSREGDPNLHDHLVIANKVQGRDGRWLTLDGRMIYAHNVAASELYNSRIAHHITADLGLQFVDIERKGRTIHELAGISPQAISQFSARRADIQEKLMELEKNFIDEHGYAPNTKQRQALQQQATLATRPKKKRGPLTGRNEHPVARPSICPGP